MVQFRATYVNSGISSVAKFYPQTADSGALTWDAEAVDQWSINTVADGDYDFILDVTDSANGSVTLKITGGTFTGEPDVTIKDPATFTRSVSKDGATIVVGYVLNGAAGDIVIDCSVLIGKGAE